MSTFPIREDTERNVKNNNNNKSNKNNNSNNSINNNNNSRYRRRQRRQLEREKKEEDQNSESGYQSGNSFRALKLCENEKMCDDSTIAVYNELSAGQPPALKEEVNLSTAPKELSTESEGKKLSTAPQEVERQCVMTQRVQRQSGMSQDVRDQSGIALRSVQLPKDVLNNKYTSSYSVQQKSKVIDSPLRNLEVENMKGISRNVGMPAQTDKMPDKFGRNRNTNNMV